MSLFRPQTPFLQNNAWQNQALNALRYNTSQLGSVLPLIYGTVRQQVNLISLGNYMGPNGGGKKGKGRGALPLGGTNTVQGKGGGGGKKGGGKKGNQDFTVDVAFAMCQGPITFNSANLVFANAQVEAFSATGLHFNGGGDGQAGDPTFNGIGSGINYSGTCWITGTPMDLGTSPTIPNLGFELSGLLYDTGGGDANPGNVITDFLTNARYGCGFPAANLDDLISPGNSVANYCTAFGLFISVSLEGQQRAAQWLDGLCRLLNVVPVCSGSLLKFIPRGDLSLGSFTPNLTPVYALTDHDFMPWHPHQDGAEPEVGQDDPIVVTRTNPADAFNWFTIEYLDRANFYNATPLLVYDQAAIDAYGLRIGDSLPGKCFANAHAAQVSAQLILQRAQFIRDLYKFQIGWDKALLEVMDIVTLTGSLGDSYLVNEAVRVIQIEENDNGDLTVEAEPVVVGTGNASVATSGGGGGGGGGGLPTPGWTGLEENVCFLCDSLNEIHQSAACVPGPPVGMETGCSFVDAVSITPGHIAVAGVTTPNPCVVLVNVIYGQSGQTGFVGGIQYDPDPQIAAINSPVLGAYQRRGFQVMYPSQCPQHSAIDYPCVYKQELWWAPAPAGVTNEVVTVAMSSPVKLFWMGVLAVWGFSAAGVMKPWGANATIYGANWSTDGEIVHIDHVYTSAAGDTSLRFAAQLGDLPGVEYPGGYVDGYFYANPSPPPVSFSSGFPDPALMLGQSPDFIGNSPGSTGTGSGTFDGTVAVLGVEISYGGGSFTPPRQINQYSGNVFPQSAQGYPWPLWMIMADALHYS